MRASTYVPAHPTNTPTRQKDGEEISVLRIPFPELQRTLGALETERGFLIDIAVASYAAGTRSQ